MAFKDLKNLAQVKEFVASIENIDCGFRSSYLNTKNYSYIKLNARIIEFPKEPIDGIFNRVVINQPLRSDYFSCSFEPFRKISKRSFKNRHKIKGRYLSEKKILQDTDFHFDENLNYDSPFFTIKDPAAFLQQWLDTVFSDGVVAGFLGGKSLTEYLEEYKRRFVSSEVDYWERSLSLLRIVEERNDLRIIVLINPFDLRPELALTSLEETGIVTPVMGMIYGWFSYEKLISLEKRMKFSFSEETRYDKIPTIRNNEQVFQMDGTPFLIDGMDIRDLVRKGARRQVSFHNSYYQMLLDFYPSDVFEKSEFEGEECHSADFFGKKLKYFHGRRIYFKPEFDLLFSLYPVLNKDDDGMEYLEFYFQMRYRPFIRSRADKSSWTWHHVLEDLGK